MPFLGKIRIECQADDTLPLSELTEFQGELKKRTDQDIENLKTKILEVGFSYPFFVWQTDEYNFCLDGHGRILALKSLEAEGYELPERFPVVFIYADDEIEAKDKLLQAASSYGVITQAGLIELTDGMNIELADLTFANEYIDFSGNVFSEEGELSPRQNAMKIAVFGKYKIPVSDSEIELFLNSLAEYQAETGSRDGFFKAKMGYGPDEIPPEKQQEIS